MKNLLNRQNRNLPKSIYQELENYIWERKNDYQNYQEDWNKLVDDQELHHELFNRDYYIIGYYEASEWLKEHGVSILEALAYIDWKEQEMFGESQFDLSDANEENITNMLVYFAGEEVLYNIEQDDLMFPVEHS